MRAIDFEQHNEQVQAVWDAYRRRQPVRVPIVFGINPRYSMFDHPANPRRLTFRQFFEDPQVMLERQLEHQAWVRLHVPQDAEMGLPRDGWQVAVNFLNSYEAAWWGCRVRYYDDQIPDTEPLAGGDRKLITDSIILRLQAYRRRLKLPLKTPGWSLADDSVQLISTRMYKELVLPHHRRLVETFAEGGPIHMHLCGDSTRHFRFLRDALNVQSFDTGFPIEFGRVREQVGPDVQLQGGPSVVFLQTATPAVVRAEVRRILHSGVLHGGRFILREGNNLPPGVPLVNLRAMYDAGRQYGRYEGGDLASTAGGDTAA